MFLKIKSRDIGHATQKPIPNKEMLISFSVASISVIDTQSSTFATGRNETLFPSSSTPSASSNSSANATSSTSNRVNQHLQLKKTATATTDISSNNNNNFLNDWNDVIRLPNSAIGQLKKASNAKDEQKSFAKVVFQSFKNLHQLLADADQQLADAEAPQGEELVVNSRVISVSVDSVSSSNGETTLGDSVKIRLQHLQKTSGSHSDVVCVFWDLVS